MQLCIEMRTSLLISSTGVVSATCQNCMQADLFYPSKFGLWRYVISGQSDAACMLSMAAEKYRSTADFPGFDYHYIRLHSVQISLRLGKKFPCNFGRYLARPWWFSSVLVLAGRYFFCIEHYLLFSNHSRISLSSPAHWKHEG